MATTRATTKLFSMSVLEQAGIAYREIKLPRAPKSAQDIISMFKCPLNHVIKTLVFIGANRAVVVSVPGDCMVDMPLLKAVANVDDLKMATAKQIAALTGYQIGGVSPIFPKSDTQAVTFILDPGCLTPEKINIGSGEAAIGLEINANDLKTIWSNTAIIPAGEIAAVTVAKAQGVVMDATQKPSLG